MAQAEDPFSPSSLDSRCWKLFGQLPDLDRMSLLPQALPPALDERMPWMISLRNIRNCDGFDEILEDIYKRDKIRRRRCELEEILKKTSKYIKFSVSSSQKGGIDIKIHSVTGRIPMNCSVHNPAVQMLLFAKMSLFQNSCRSPRALACKAIRHIINGSRFDSCNEVYEIGWVPTKCQAKSPIEQDISETRPQKLDRQTDKSTWDWPVISDMLKNGETLVSQISRYNKTQRDCSTVDTCTIMGPVPSQWHAPLKCNVEHMVSSIEDLSVSRLEQSACCNGDDCDNVPNKLSIDCTELQSDSASEQELEEHQYMLNKQSDMSCVSNHQPISCSRYPDANDISMCDTETASFSEDDGDGGECHDSKIYALVTPQSPTPVDGSGSSSTHTLPDELLCWLDSGANHHVVRGDSDLCNQRDPSHAVSVKVADGFQWPVTKVGDIQTADIQVPDVYLVPGLQVNLISVHQLAQSKIFTTFYENHAELWLEGEQVGGAIVDNNLYRLRFLKVIRP